ncbi:MAG: hypothetical protein KF833_06505 [Verrucomicrobiae bacterium]|nr:hypothetical protein [Verrucomicrobiae bacterium]
MAAELVSGRSSAALTVREVRVHSLGIFDVLGEDSGIGLSSAWWRGRAVPVTAEALEAEPGSREEGAADGMPERPVFRVEVWGADEGLPHAKVRSLLEAGDGTLWVGTAEGLARHDGMRLRPFEPGEDRMGTRRISSVRALHEEGGRLWVGTRDGLFCIQAGTLHDTPVTGALAGMSVDGLGTRRAGGFWVGTERGIAWVDGGAVKWLKGLGERVSAVAEDANGVVWAGTTDGVAALDAADGRLLARHLTREHLRRTDDLTTAVHGLHVDARQGVWMGVTDGVWRLAPGAAGPERMTDGTPGFEGPQFARMTGDRFGTVWATNQRDGGLYRFVPGTGDAWTVDRLVPEVTGTASLLIDRLGDLWVGSRTGLKRLREEPFRSLAIRASAMDWSLHAVAVGDGNEVWGASGQGVIHRAGRQVRLFSFHGFPGLAGMVVVPGPGGGADVIGAGGARVRLPPASHALGGWDLALRTLAIEGRLQAAIRDAGGALMLGTSAGLFRMEDGGVPVRVEAMPAADVRALHRGHDGDLWVGTADAGLGKLRRGRYETVVDAGNSGIVHGMVTRPCGGLWLASNAGVGRIRNGEWRLLAVDSRTPVRGVVGVVVDGRGDLWIHHGSGVARVRAAGIEAWEQGTVRSVWADAFGVSDGMVPGEPAGRAGNVGITGDGRLWFARRNGLVTFDPEELPTSAPTIRIEGWEVDGRSREPWHGARVHPAERGAIRIEFSVTGLYRPGQERVEHRLAGYDRAWRETGLVREAVYADLRPGRYTFEVRAGPSSGSWMAETSFGFRVMPHWWERGTVWALSGLGVLAGAMGGAALRWRKERRSLEDQRRRELERERMRIARDLHDHLGSHLSVAAMQGAAGASDAPARDALDALNELVWSVHPENDSMAALTDFIGDFSARYLDAAGLTVDLDLPAEVPACIVPGAWRRDVAAMLKEALRNVVRHAGAGRVRVGWLLRDGECVLTVADDGRGCDTNGGGASMPEADGWMPRHGTATLRRRARTGSGGQGLRGLEARCRELGGTCTLRSREGHGTRITFRLPWPTPNGKEREGWREDGVAPGFPGKEAPGS